MPHNPEYDIPNSHESSDGGYSEKQLDVDAEIQAGEWETLKNFKTYQRRSRQWKIIATYKAITNRLNQLVSMYYKLVSSNTKQGEKLLKDLRHLRALQEILLQCMSWEPKGQLEKDMVPEEVWELIK